ncbi:MAG TPA: amidophosphoribosyltransferase [Rectinemataceae bacterium]|nr:amidophosphoribosyltransferase [Rectinemataceae bacterium]
MSGPREECGVVGIAMGAASLPGSHDAARTAFYGLFALQHRGQEAAGIASSDGGTINLHKDLGLVSQVFREGSLEPLKGGLAIGHTRYSTTGSSSMRNAQPFVIDTRHGPLAVAHNGNIANAPALRRALLDRGIGLSSASDTELLAMDLAGAEGRNWPERIAKAMAGWVGAFSLLVLTMDAVYALRDPWGFRPLARAVLADGSIAFASETSALRMLGAKTFEEVGPGQIVEARREGMVLHEGMRAAPKSSCSFEYVYFSRPDSEWNGRTVHAARRALGSILAKEAPAEADIVVPVPDSAIPPAIGYAEVSGIPYEEGLVKNRYIGRTFIEPTEALRKRGVALKFSPLVENIANKRIVLIDDSIVRGTTTRALVELLRGAGAREIHLRVASPPIRHPCYMGVDMGDPAELVARRLDAGGLARELGVESLAWLSLEGLRKAIGVQGLCEACFSGSYPIPIDEVGAKSLFERGGA